MSDLHFVIQEHTTTSGIHWDLMLERENALWTWRLNVPPEQIENTPVTAERIADHPLRFLTYEGPVQNRTGQVRISDNGELIWQAITPTQMSCKLSGRILKGLYHLTLKDESNWIFKQDV